MDFLTIVTPDGRTLRREIGPECVRIGRAADNDLSLDDPNVSRNHARLSRRSDGFYLEDAGAKNGVFVNGTRVEGEARLLPGDRFRLGSTTLILNAADSGVVEFTDTPLHQGSGTMVLRAATVLGTPAPGVAPAAGAAARPGPVGIGLQGAAAGRGAGIASWPAILAEANEQLVFHRPLPELLETIMDLARRAVPFERGLLMLLQGERLVPQVVRVPPDEAARPLAVSRTIADRVVRDKESVLTSDALHDDRFMRGESVEAQHLRSVMCVPLWNNREVIGLIYVDNRHRAGLFQEENLRILTHLANVAAVKIENARLFGQALAAERMELDLQRAAEIQRFLLPAVGPSIPGYRLHGRSLPCREVGGDTYDFLELPEGRCAVSLGDVAGKGLPAALVMCSFQAALRALTGLALPAAEIGARLNRLLCRQIPENRFVTLFFAILDPAAHRLEYFNAGHNPPCLLRRDGPPERLPVTGPPLGMFEEAAIGVRRVELGPGDLLVCYSDGVTEETGGGEKEFGEERLFEVAREGLTEGPEGAAARIAGALGDHLGDAPRQDDTTLVLLQRIG